MDPVIGKSWYVIQTNPREEERALHYLNEKGVETFFPRIQVVRYRDVKVGLSIKPMFPSYLFAHFRAPADFPYVQWTRGVKRILGGGDEPLPVPDDVVDLIRGQVDHRGVVKVGRRLKPKDRVRIRSGPFKDLLGIFERDIDDQGRVEILLNLMGYQARVQLHESLVERIP
jgi:transcription elongation factor/antiterminator RfaH